MRRELWWTEWTRHSRSERCSSRWIQYHGSSKASVASSACARSGQPCGQSGAPSRAESHAPSGAQAATAASVPTSKARFETIRCHRSSRRSPPRGVAQAREYGISSSSSATSGTHAAIAVTPTAHAGQPRPTAHTPNARQPPVIAG